MDGAEYILDGINVLLLLLDAEWIQLINSVIELYNNYNRALATQ